MSSYPDWPTIANSHRVRGKIYPRLAEDMPSFLGVPVACSPSDLRGSEVVIIGAPFAAGWGKMAGLVMRKRGGLTLRAGQTASGSDPLEGTDLPAAEVV
ncbi:MAG TPA: hypothetical protein VJY39_22840 [Acidisphaera sp.]|nr:hypothetical protein [Acidisphaera sp.]